MKKTPVQVITTIVREVFPGKIEEYVAAALTIVLNRYNIRLSDESPVGSGPVELTLNASASIVSKLEIESLTDPSTWLRRSIQLQEANWNTSEFETTMQEVVRRINEHPWVDGLEDDWELQDG